MTYQEQTYTESSSCPACLPTSCQVNYLKDGKAVRVPGFNPILVYIHDCYCDFRAHLSNDAAGRTSNVASTNTADSLNLYHLHGLKWAETWQGKRLNGHHKLTLQLQHLQFPDTPVYVLLLCQTLLPSVCLHINSIAS